MSFLCPSCNQHALKISSTMELPPIVDDDEIAVQILKCENCELLAMAVYRESRHGRLDSESWRHDGYVLEHESLEELMTAMLACRVPDDRRCGCASHLALAKKNWVTPEQSGLNVKERFEMVWTQAEHSPLRHGGTEKKKEL